MWISSSPCKNRVSNRGRIDIFSGWKASLLLLALASFSVVCAASGLPEWCDPANTDTCFAKNSDDLADKQPYISVTNGKITWNATDASSIDLYTRKCGKLSFIMSTSKLANSDEGGKCEFSMLYNDNTMVIEWTIEKTGDILKFLSKNGGLIARGFVESGSEVNVDLEGTKLSCEPKCGEGSLGFDLTQGGDWCSFKFAFNKKTGSCDGKIQFDTDYKLLATPAPTTVAPKPTTTPDADYENTTPGADAAGLSPWIIAGIVVAVLLLVAVVVGLLVFFLIRRRKRRGSPQNMVEKGNVENDPQCVSALSHTNTTQVAATNMKSGSEMVGEPSANEHKEDEERSKPASKVEVVKPMSQKKKKDNTYQSLAVLQKEEAKNEPAPSPSPLPEENKPKRKLTPDELYEPLGDPMKAIPMHLSEKKISEKKISSKKQKKKVEEEAKNTPATPSPSRSSKKKKSEKKKKDDHYHRLSSLENEAKK